MQDEIEITKAGVTCAWSTEGFSSSSPVQSSPGAASNLDLLHQAMFSSKVRLLSTTSVHPSSRSFFYWWSKIPVSRLATDARFYLMARHCQSDTCASAACNSRASAIPSCSIAVLAWFETAVSINALDRDSWMIWIYRQTAPISSRHMSEACSPPPAQSRPTKEASLSAQAM